MDVMNAENAGAFFCPALLYYRPSMALCNICIDLQGGRKCRKIAWSNRGPHIPVGYAGTQAQGRETVG